MESKKQNKQLRNSTSQPNTSFSSASKDSTIPQINITMKQKGNSKKMMGKMEKVDEEDLDDMSQEERNSASSESPIMAKNNSQNKKKIQPSSQKESQQAITKILLPNSPAVNYTNDNEVYKMPLMGDTTQPVIQKIHGKYGQPPNTSHMISEENSFQSSISKSGSLSSCSPISLGIIPQTTSSIRKNADLANQDNDSKNAGQQSGINLFKNLQPLILGEQKEQFKFNKKRCPDLKKVSFDNDDVHRFVENKEEEKIPPILIQPKGQLGTQKQFKNEKKMKKKSLKQISGLDNKFTRKNEQDNDKYSGTRFMLFYADDVIQNTKKLKNEIGYYMPNSDGTSCAYQIDHSVLENPTFRRDLRENQGIFFDLSISPNSPMKHRTFGNNQSSSSFGSPLGGTYTSALTNLVRQNSLGKGHLMKSDFKSIQLLKMDQTDKESISPLIHSNKSSPSQQAEKVQINTSPKKKENNLFYSSAEEQMDENRNADSLLNEASPNSEQDFQKSVSFNLKQQQVKQESMSISPISVQKIQENEEIKRMRLFGEYIKDNYLSPDQQEISKVLRLREIQKLNKKKVGIKQMSIRNLLNNNRENPQTKKSFNMLLLRSFSFKNKRKTTEECPQTNVAKDPKITSSSKNVVQELQVKKTLIKRNIQSYHNIDELEVLKKEQKSKTKNDHLRINLQQSPLAISSEHDSVSDSQDYASIKNNVGLRIITQESIPSGKPSSTSQSLSSSSQKSQDTDSLSNLDQKQQYPTMSNIFVPQQPAQQQKNEQLVQLTLQQQSPQNLQIATGGGIMKMQRQTSSPSSIMKRRQMQLSSQQIITEKSQEDTPQKQFRIQNSTHTFQNGSSEMSEKEKAQRGIGSMPSSARTGLQPRPQQSTNVVETGHQYSISANAQQRVNLRSGPSQFSKHNKFLQVFDQRSKMTSEINSLKSEITNSANDNNSDKEDELASSASEDSPILDRLKQIQDIRQQKMSIMVRKEQQKRYLIKKNILPNDMLLDLIDLDQQKRDELNSALVRHSSTVSDINTQRRDKNFTSFDYPQIQSANKWQNHTLEIRNPNSIESPEKSSLNFQRGELYSDNRVEENYFVDNTKDALLSVRKYPSQLNCSNLKTGAMGSQQTPTSNENTGSKIIKRSKTSNKDESKLRTSLNRCILQSKIQIRRERRKLIKRLFQSTAEQEEENFIRNQKNHLKNLKNIVETLKSQKITENCYQEEATPALTPTSMLGPSPYTCDYHDMYSDNTPKYRRPLGQARNQNEEEQKVPDFGSVLQSPIDFQRASEELKDYSPHVLNKTSKMSRNKLLGKNTFQSPFQENTLRSITQITPRSQNLVPPVFSQNISNEEQKVSMNTSQSLDASINSQENNQRADGRDTRGSNDIFNEPEPESSDEIGNGLHLEMPKSSRDNILDRSAENSPVNYITPSFSFVNTNMSYNVANMKNECEKMLESKQVFSNRDMMPQNPLRESKTLSLQISKHDRQISASTLVKNASLALKKQATDVRSIGSGTFSRPNYLQNISNGLMKKLQEIEKNINEGSSDPVSIQEFQTQQIKRKSKQQINCERLTINLNFQNEPLNLSIRANSCKKANRKQLINIQSHFTQDEIFSERNCQVALRQKKNPQWHNNFNTSFQSNIIDRSHLNYTAENSIHQKQINFEDLNIDQREDANPFEINQQANLSRTMKVIRQPQKNNMRNKLLQIDQQQFSTESMLQYLKGRNQQQKNFQTHNTRDSSDLQQLTLNFGYGQQTPNYQRSSQQIDFTQKGINLKSNYNLVAKSQQFDTDCQTSQKSIATQNQKMKYPICSPKHQKRLSIQTQGIKTNGAAYRIGSITRNQPVNQEVSEDLDQLQNMFRKSFKKGNRTTKQKTRS